MQYPRIIKLDNPKLKKLITDKESLIKTGRGISAEIDLIKESMDSTEKKLIAEERKVDVKDLVALSGPKKKQVEALLKEFEGLQKQIYERIKANTPQELRDQYETLKKQKDDKESDLNKLGHKVQKVKDKIIPLVQKLGKPHLEDEWEDFNTTKLDEDGTPILEIYSRLEEWKATQRQNK
jgi:seryl-tRNA synthetase